MVLRAYREAFAGLPRDVWLLSAVALVNRAGTMVLPFLALWLTERRDFSVPEAARLLSLFGVGSVVGTVVGGHLTDRIGPVRVQASSLAAGGIVLFLLGRCESPSAIGALAFLLGLIGDAFRPANAALLTAIAPPDRLMRAFALNRLAINVGMTIAPAVGGVLARIDYAWLFVVDGATCLAAAALFLAFFAGRSPTTEDDDEAAARSGRGPWRDGVFLACLGAAFVVACIFMQTMSTLPPYLRETYRLREDAIGLLFAINPLVITLFEMVLVHRVQRPNPLRIVALAALFTGGGFALLPHGSTFAFGALAMIVVTVGEMLDAPLLGGFLAGRAAPRFRGRAMALYALVFSGSLVAAPELGGLVYDRLGPEALWHGCGVAGVVVAILYLALARRVDRAESAAAPADR